MKKLAYKVRASKNITTTDNKNSYNSSHNDTSNKGNLTDDNDDT